MRSVRIRTSGRVVVGIERTEPDLIGPEREEAAKRLLTPESVLMLLEPFTLFRHPASAAEVMTKMVRGSRRSRVLRRSMTKCAAVEAAA